MAQTAERTGTGTGRTVYELEGTLLEVCSCGVLCPCWIGEDPDGGECYGIVAYHFDAGQVDGVDVAGLNVVNLNHIPGNILTPGSWRVVMLVDERATPEQERALVRAFGGEYGGPLADLAGLVGELVAVERAPISHEIRGGKGVLRAGRFLEAELVPYLGSDGATTTTLRDSIFSTVPGSPAYVAKATRNLVDLPRHGLVWEFEGRNAIQADYHMEHGR